MPVYQWVGKNKKNEVLKDFIDAPDEAAARAALTRRGIIPTTIKPKPKDIFENIAFLQPKISEKDVIVFCRQFSTMIDAGLPIIQCLDILHSQQENKKFKIILKTIKENVESGSTLAESMKKYPDLFDNLFVNMIAAGEAGGILDTILKRLSAHLEKAAKLKAKVKSAMMYPMITIFVAVIVVMVIMVFVIPVFQKMFEEMGAKLPGLTLLVVNISNFVKSNVIYMGVGTGLLVFAVKKFYATEKGKIVIDGLLLRAPVFGLLIRKVAVAKFTRTMGTMLASGVSILDSMDIVAKTAGNKIVEKAIYDTRTGISQGRSMSDPLAESGVFPAMVCQMIAVGESTGALDSMLEKIADFYDDEVDEAVNSLTEMIEPMMMVFLGVVVGGLVIAMYLPIFSMAGNIS